MGFEMEIDLVVERGVMRNLEKLARESEMQVEMLVPELLEQAVRRTRNRQSAA